MATRSTRRTGKRPHDKGEDALLLLLLGGGALGAMLLTRGKDTGPTAPTTGLPSAVHVPYGSVWRGMQVISGHEPFGWAAPEFDDSGWPLVTAAIGSGGFCALQSTVLTPWEPGTDFLIRGQIPPVAGTPSAVVNLVVDNDAEIFWNGAHVGSVSHDGCPSYGDHSITVVPGLATNTLAIQGIDRGGQSFLDAEVVVQ